MALVPNGVILANSDRGGGTGGTTVNNNWNCGCCGNGSGGGTTDHEALENLLGGDSTGHYHLTKAEYEALLKLIEEPEPEPEPEPWTVYDGGFPYTTEEELKENEDHWLDGGYPESQCTEVYDGGDVA